MGVGAGFGLRCSDPKCISQPRAGDGPEANGQMSKRMIKALGAQGGLTDVRGAF